MLKSKNFKIHKIKIITFYPFFTKKFTDLNDAYDKCNWKVKILTQTAVSDHDGITNFYSDHDNANLEWGGTVFGIKKIKNY